MAQRAVRLSDLQEKEYARALVNAGRATVVLIVGGLVWYFARFAGSHNGVAVLWVAALIITFAACIYAQSIYIAFRARQYPAVSVSCPYCDAATNFVDTPGEDWACEHCNRTVKYENGRMVPVQTVVCQFCHTEHRVAVNVDRFVCDRCNHPLDIRPNEREAAVAGRPDGQAKPGEKFDVLLVAVPRPRENEVAMKLQNLLFVNLREARQRMSGASHLNPLVVGTALEPLKAEAIRRQLQDLGATAMIRPTGQS